MLWLALQSSYLPPPKSRWDQKDGFESVFAGLSTVYRDKNKTQILNDMVFELPKAESWRYPLGGSAIRYPSPGSSVIGVLQPGPLGIVEHKFSSEVMSEANATVKRAVENWRRNANLEARLK